MTDEIDEIEDQDEGERAKAEQRKHDFNELLAEKKAKHRRVLGWLDDECGPLIFRTPKRSSMKRFIAESSDDDADFLGACENLALSSVVYPERGKLSAIFDDLPALATTIANELVKFSTTSAKPRGKR